MYLIGIFFIIFYIFINFDVNSDEFSDELYPQLYPPQLCPQLSKNITTKGILYKHNKTYTRSKYREKKLRHVIFNQYNYRLHFDKNIPLVGKPQLFCDEILMKS